MRKKGQILVKDLFENTPYFGNILFYTFRQIHRAPQTALLSCGYMEAVATFCIALSDLTTQDLISRLPEHEAETLSRWVAV